MKSEYQVDIRCQNCRKVNWIHNIPTGTIVNDFLEKEKSRCRICDCLIFKEKPVKEEKASKEVIKK